MRSPGVHLLRAHLRVAGQRVFVLGHSLGGTVAPRVAEAEKSIAGLLIMAGGTYPLHRSAVRQVRYLASLNSANAGSAQATIEKLTKQADTVDSADLSPETPETDLPFGVPAAYWLDLRSYDAPTVAATLDKPVLVIQGGRDYQATVADDLAGWRKTLSHKQNVEIRVYDDDNHVFFAGTGASTPAEYQRPGQHVDAAVVADIAAFVLSS
ncbi:S9 family peptidase [Skermania sp. ID1734]|uniref:alpha/beta hydrolase family protein n=1 Tax=Skermania sp. ID1734 TaxID=2597516 RepID=UPI0021064436|nr:alpha/beta fold hydrolase [Skermania sp. ID1734]